MNQLSEKQPTFIDLFSGCGGFSLGLKLAGFSELAAIDFNPAAIAVFKANFPELSNYIFEKDLRIFEPTQLEKNINKKNVDIIVGGPPCQGFSWVRQRDGANSGNRLIEDSRRELYIEFLKYVKHFSPKIFVMENVLGIRTAAGGYFLNKVQSEARKLGYRVHEEVINAWEFGVPQKRVRQFIIGTKLNYPIFSCSIYMPQTHSKNQKNQIQKVVSLWEAIGDLPPVCSGCGEEISDYDLEIRKNHLKKYGRRYIINVLEINKSSKLTAHRARSHSNRDLRDFNILREGETGEHAISRGIKMEFPYNKNSFKDRYTKQHRDQLCSTIVAHLSKDGLMFIHPTQNRSLTPREAARIQSFPDWFKFPVARTHQFSLIGNAVPPLLGKALGMGISKWFSAISKFVSNTHLELSKINEKQAVKHLIKLVSIGNNGGLSKLSPQEFKLGWFAIGYFYNHLHPDSTKENGFILSEENLSENPFLYKNYPTLVKPIFQRSGWPVILKSIACEAMRRLEAGELNKTEYYCTELNFTNFEYLSEEDQYVNNK